MSEWATKKLFTKYILNIMSYSYNYLQVVSDVRNKLGHPPVKDQISEQECDDIFVRLESLVDVLHELHPDIVSTPADIKTELQKVCPVKTSEGCHVPINSLPPPPPNPQRGLKW